MLPPVCASGAAARSSERARLSALHRGARRGFDPSAQLRAAFPGITGCKRDDPPRRQCSELLADRSWCARSWAHRPPGCGVCRSARGDRSRSTFESTLAKVSLKSEIFAFNRIRRPLSNAVVELGVVTHCKSLKQRPCSRETLGLSDSDARCERNQKTI